MPGLNKNLRHLFWIFLLFAALQAPMRALAEEPNETPPESAPALDTAQDAAVLQAEETESVVTPEEELAPGKFSAAYYAVFYGPSLQHPGSSLQATPSGDPDPNRPIIIKNFFNLGYSLTKDITLNGTAYWIHTPVKGHDLTLGDPSLRLAHNRLIHTDQFNIYADVRVHFAVTKPSRHADLLTSFQSFQITSYQFKNFPLSIGAYTSIKTNLYGKEGAGSDVELYFGPNLSYQLTPSIAFTLLYETGASHAYGDDTNELVADGSDLQPGLALMLGDNLFLNPFLNIYTNKQISLRSTSFGMTFSWQMF
jgi:hypothetical protein